MHNLVETAARFVALACDAATIAVIAWGALLALWRVVLTAGRAVGHPVKRDVWVRFAGWIALALEFALAADIARTALEPTWDEIGQLAAIAAIRTLLNLFLTRDIEKLQGGNGEPPGQEN